MTSLLDDLIRRIAQAQTENTGPGQPEIAIQLTEADLRRLADPLTALPEVERLALRNLATARTFDAELADQCLLAGLSQTVRFAELVASPYVAALAGRAGRYEVTHANRDALFRTWWSTDTGPTSALSIPEGLRELSQCLAGASLVRGDELEHLYHLVVAEPTSACSLFDHLFEAADAAFDLPRCQALLHILEERQDLLDPALTTLLQEKRLRLEARIMWSQEYYATTGYFERVATRDLMSGLIAGQDYWILHLHARGGLGKTKFIQAALARHCVPRGIPCARIDFDFMPHIAEAAREPWRLLLRITDQLNRQLAGRPFEALLADYAPYAAEAGGRRKARARNLVPLDPGAHARIPQEVATRFVATIEEIQQGQPYLLVFDTIEELRLRQVDLGAALDLLRELRQSSPSLRVILAGRYNLRENEPGARGHSTGFVERFGDQGHTTQLLPFDDDEAHSYLEQKRGMSGDERLSTIIAKGEGNPFKLALLADIVRDNPKLTSREIEEYAAVDLIYLIERVVDRIKDARVRWVLRYGVVPHQLTLDFVEKVMMPYLQRGIIGDDTLDNPRADDLPERVRAREPFATDLGATQLDARALWQDLAQYSSQASWVYPAPGLPNTLAFHPEVREPMRYLLREQQRQERNIYVALNREAVRYFEVLAELEPADRARWLREAVYHQFQASDRDGAAEYWRHQLDAAADDPETAVALAEQILELAGAPELRSTGERSAAAQVSNALKAQAAYELARRSLDSAAPLTEGERLKARSWLDMAEGFNSADSAVLPFARLAEIRGRLDLADGKAEAALSIGLRALQRPVDTRNETELRLLAADALRALGRSREAVVHCRLALDLTKAVRQGGTGRVALKLAQNLQSSEEYLEAAGIYRQCQDEALAAGDLNRAARYLIEIIHANLALGREAEAARQGELGLIALQAATVTSGLDRLTLSPHWRSAVQAEIELARLRPGAARSEIDNLLREDGRSAMDPETATEWPALESDLRARIATASWDLRQAVACHDRLAWDIHGPGTRAGLRSLLNCANMYINLMGDLRQAERYLAAIRENEQRYDPREGWRVCRQLLEIQSLALLDRHDEAQQMAAALAREIDPDWPPGLRVQIALEVVMQGDTQAGAVDAVLAVLQRVQPHSQRLLLLDGLCRLSVAETLPIDMVMEMLQLLPDPSSEGQDPARAALRLAEVLRLGGRVEAAQKLLQGVEETGRTPVCLALLRGVYLAYDRLGWPEHLLAAIALPADEDSAWQESSYLSGLLLLEHAERLAKVSGDMERAASLLDRAAAILDDSSSFWSARIAALRGGIAVTAQDGAASEREWRRAVAAFDALGNRPGAVAAFERALVIDTSLYGAAHRATVWGTTNLVALLYYVNETAGVARAVGLAAVVAQDLNLAAAANSFGTMLYIQGNLEQARAAFQQAMQYAAPDSSARLQYLDNLVVLLHAQGDYAGARTLLEHARAAYEKTLGPNHPAIATLLNNLAALLQAQGNYADARPHFERALAIREQVLGPTHPTTAIALSNLAVLLQAQGDYAGARPHFEHALAIREQALGPNHPDTALALNNLANLLQAEGNYAGAEPLYERALAIREQVLGPSHPDTALALNNLAVVLYAQGDYGTARPHFERALAIREQALGPTHPTTAITLSNLAVLLQAQGDYAGARPHFERALAILEQALGPSHPDTATALSNLASLLQAEGDYAGAEPLYERALAIREQVLGPSHPDTATALNNLASLLQAEGDYAGARPHFERALAICEQALGPNHPATALALNNLANLLQAEGDYAGAEPLYERALAIREQTLGPSHPDTALALNNLANLLRTRSDYVAARPLYERALAIYERVLGPNHPSTVTTLNNLTDLLQAQGDYTGARTIYERALAVYERLRGPDHADTATALSNLAFVLRAEGDYLRARSLYERALAIYERVLGPNHPSTATTLNNLADLLRAQGDYVGARLLLERTAANPADIHPADAGHKHAYQISVNLKLVSSAVLRVVLTKLEADGDTSTLVNESALPAELARVLRTNTGESVSALFVQEFAHNWLSVSARLGEAIFQLGRHADYFDGDAPFGLCWEMQDAGLDWLPWELVRRGPAEPPFQLTSACRYLLRLTARSQLFRPELTSTRVPMTVLILRAHSFSDRYADSRPDLVELYERSNIPTTELPLEQAGELITHMTRLRPRVVHIVSGIRGRGSRLLLDSGAAASDVANILLKSKVTPLVVLDTPAPPGLSERVRQLCVRNAFAAELARKTSLDVLATGLGDPFQRAKLWAILVAALGDRLPIVEIARRISALAAEVHPAIVWADPQAPPTLESVLPFLGTVLFADAPPADAGVID